MDGSILRLEQVVCSFCLCSCFFIFLISRLLEIQVSEEQVVMAHSPLCMFKQFHDKQVLVSGQGPTLDIAKW